MGEAFSIEVPANVPGPVAPGQEEEVANTTEQPVTETVEEVTDKPQVDIPTDRPEWLPEKFENPEAMAKAYGELESKLSSGDKTGEETSETPGNIEVIQQYSEKFFKEGSLSDDDYAGLEAIGLPKDLVDSFIQGQQAMLDSSIQQIYSEVGGEERYGNMIDWAKENISSEEIASYNEMVDSGDQNKSLMAVRGLFARYSQAGDTGSSPGLVQGETSGSGTSAYQSVQQLTEAMSDPRYSNDPAYRKTVTDRLAVSNIF